MSEHISKEQAQEIAIRYLASKLQNLCDTAGEIYDGIPDDLCFYGQSSSDRKDFWCIYVPAPDDLRVGGSRYICISKKTGKIVADSMSGE